MSKNPWIAAILNTIIAGLGYLYLGRRKEFGFLLIASDALAYYWFFTNPEAQKAFESPLITISWILLVAAFAWDAYKEAKQT